MSEQKPSPESLTTSQLRKRILAQMEAVVPDTSSQAAHRTSRQGMYERREPDSLGLLPGFLQ